MSVTSGCSHCTLGHIHLRASIFHVGKQKKKGETLRLITASVGLAWGLEDEFITGHLKNLTASMEALATMIASGLDELNISADFFSP